LQDRADNDKRGDVIAAGNLVDCFLGIMSVAVQAGMKAAGLSPQLQCGVLAITSAAVAVFISRNTRSLA
jgi:membrane protein implicated in regulation of membrane protease activity